MSALNSPDPIARAFRARCRERNVPREAIGRTVYVGAARVVGQGSPFMRKAAIDSLLMLAGALPEEGRSNLIADKVAAEAGQAAVERYFPRKEPTTATEQQAEAAQWVGVMKAGVPVVVSSSQNAVVYAMTFLGAATEALKSLTSGADPAQVLQFLNVVGPSIGAQLQRISKDPTREQVFGTLKKQWEALAKATDKLKGVVAQMGEAQAQQRQKTQTAMTDDQIKQQKLAADIAIKTAKTKAQLEQSRMKAQAKLAQDQQGHQQGLAERSQGMVIKDAEAASAIRRDNAVAAHEALMREQELAMAAASTPSGEE
jgi:hypothetical protein